LSLIGCEPANRSLPPENGIGERAEPVAADGLEGQSILFKAKYFKTRAPCHRIGDGWAMPIADGFEVIQVLRGTLKPPTEIIVRPRSARGQAYPRHLKSGEVCVLELTPSADTLEQLKERERDGHEWIWVDGNELEQQAQK
jgi:hypothetical protein